MKNKQKLIELAEQLIHKLNYNALHYEEYSNELSLDYEKSKDIIFQFLEQLDPADLI